MTFLSCSFSTYKMESLPRVAGFFTATGVPQSPRVFRSYSEATFGMREAMGTVIEVQAIHGHLGYEVLWRAAPPSGSQNLISVGDTNRSLWRGKLRQTEGRGERSPWENRNASLHLPL